MSPVHWPIPRLSNQSSRERKKVEMCFAHMKRIFKLDRLRLRGLGGAGAEVLLTAIAQNLRRLDVSSFADRHHWRQSPVQPSRAPTVGYRQHRRMLRVEPDKSTKTQNATSARKAN